MAAARHTPARPSLCPRHAFLGRKKSSRQARPRVDVADESAPPSRPRKGTRPSPYVAYDAPGGGI
eukprot:6633207-Prymnesium_polylepis.1